MKIGRLVVCVGPMFAGKSETLIRHVEAAHRFGMKVQVFKPKIDNRYSDSEVVSHSGMRIPATPVSTEGTMPPVPDDVEFVGIDEAQFFSPAIVRVVDELTKRGVHVTACGLDLTYLGQPFEPMPALMALADEVIKITARCSCGKPATRTQKLTPTPTDSSSTLPVLVGGAEMYRPKCRSCHIVPDQVRSNLDKGESVKIFSVEVREQDFIVELDNGCVFPVPFSEASPLLERATPSQRQNFRIRGRSIYWIDLDEDLSLAGLIQDFGKNEIYG